MDPLAVLLLAVFLSFFSIAAIIWILLRNRKTEKKLQKKPLTRKIGFMPVTGYGAFHYLPQAGYYPKRIIVRKKILILPKRIAERKIRRRRRRI